jgi:hypothetical protein
MKAAAVLLIFAVILTSAFGWYMQPNLKSVSGSGDHSQVYKALGDFFAKLSDDAVQVASASVPGRR